MARLYYVHWNKDEALETVRALRDAGHIVRYHYDSGEETWKMVKESPPDALVISLDRLPSHGRRVAAVTKVYKKLRVVPLIFVGGEPVKVDVARKEFPAATFCTLKELLKVLVQLD